MSLFTQKLNNPNDVQLVCPHCGGRDFFYKIVCDFTVFFTTEDNDIDIYERDPGVTKEYETIYCAECEKRAFKRTELEKLGVTIPI